MEENIENTPEENGIRTETHCTKCSFSLNTDVVFCPNCGFPERGTEEEKSMYEYNREMAGRDLDRTKKKIKSARITLIIVSVLQFLVSFAILLVSKDITAFVVMFAVACIFLGLSLYCKKKPFPALLTALILYVFLGILDAFADPSTIIKGLLAKSIIVTFLIIGLFSAIEARNIMKKNNIAF